MARKRLGEILIDAGLLDQEGLDRALAEQKRWAGGQLGQYLVKLGLVSEEILVRALSKQFNLPAVALDPLRVEPDIVRRVPEKVCLQHHLVAFHVDEQRRFIDVAMADPASLDAVDHVRLATRYNVRPYFAPVSVIERIIARVFRGVSAPDYAAAAIGNTLDARTPILEPDPTGLNVTYSSEIELQLDDRFDPGAVAAEASSVSASPASVQPSVAATSQRPSGAVERPAAAAVSNDEGVYQVRPITAGVESTPAGGPLAAVQLQLSDLDTLCRQDRAKLDALLRLLVAKRVLTAEEARRLAG